jgi:predicted lipoprotein with Yx(FWY)xxD motif
MKRLLSLMVVLSVLVLVAAACSDDDDGSDAADTTTTPPTSESSETTTSTATTGTDEGAAGVEVDVSDVEGVGEIVVDGEGIALYVNTNDTPDATPTCTGQCATAWPPLLGDSVDALADTLDAANFGSVERDDGTTQVTYFDQPLYYFAADAGPGEVNGQGVGGVWFVVGVDGSPVPVG